MARPSSKFPTDLELLILKLLWVHGAQPVRRVRQLLAETANRDLAHTSVVTTLNNMVDKGYLSRKKEGNAYIFSTVLEEDAVSSGFLDDVLHRIFDGSAKALMLNLLDSKSVSDEEISELQNLIEEKRSPSSKDKP